MWEDWKWKIARRCRAKQIYKSKCKKCLIVRTCPNTFGRWGVEKVHAAVARTHFDVTMLKTHKNTTCLGRFLTLRCRKSALRCGGEHISQSKSAKHTTCEPLLEVEPTLQLQLQLYLHYTTTTLHYTKQLCIRWPLQPLQKAQLQPPFGPSVGSLWHPCIATTNLSYRFPIFETSATALCDTMLSPLYPNYGLVWVLH